MIDPAPPSRAASGAVIDWATPSPGHEIPDGPENHREADDDERRETKRAIAGRVILAGSLDAVRHDTHGQ